MLIPVSVNVKNRCGGERGQCRRGPASGYGTGAEIWIKYTMREEMILDLRGFVGRTSTRQLNARTG